MRKELIIESPRAIEAPGKFYFYNNYILITEKERGIHVIDNSLPSHPQNVAFWNIEGNADIAIKNEKMYLDQYIDLVTYDVSDFLHPTFSCRQNDVFQFYNFYSGLGYLVGYQKSNVTEEVDCYVSNGRIVYPFDDGFFISGEYALNNYYSPNVLSSGTTPTQGIAGSYTRFCFKDDYLYTINASNLRPYFVSADGCTPTNGKHCGTMGH